MIVSLEASLKPNWNKCDCSIRIGSVQDSQSLFKKIRTYVAAIAAAATAGPEILTFRAFVTLHHEMSRFSTFKGFLILVFSRSTFCADSHGEHHFKVG